MDLGPKMYTLDRKYSKNLKIRQMCSFKKKYYSFLHNLGTLFLILNILTIHNSIQQNQPQTFFDI